MRIRQIKPEFWGDEDITELSILSRLMFIGLWNLADSEGKIKGTPRFIKGQLFPYDDLTIETVNSHLDELANHARKFIQRYEIDSVEYILITRFAKHQTIYKENPKGYPNPENQSTKETTKKEVAHESTGNHRVVVEDSKTTPKEVLDDSKSNHMDKWINGDHGDHGDLDLELNVKKQACITRAHARGKKISEPIPAVEELKQAAIEAREYAQDSKNPKMRNYGWVEGFVKTEIMRLKRERPEMSLLDILAVWRETCDKAASDGVKVPKWYHTTFRGKLDEWQGNQSGGRTAQKPKIHPVYAAWQSGQDLIFKPSGDKVANQRLKPVDGSNPAAKKPSRCNAFILDNGKETGYPLYFNEFEAIGG